MNKKLYRDEYHKVIGGVCAGLAEYFETDVTIIRLLFAFTVITGGVGVIPYIVLWIVLPKKGYLYNNYNNPGVDYTVPPPPGGQFTHQGNPFGGSSFNDRSNEDNPFAYNTASNLPPKQPSHAGVIVGFVLIVVGAAILVDEYNLIPDFDLDRLWPAILVLVGAALIVSGQKKKIWHSQDWQATDIKGESVKEETPAATDANSTSTLES